MRFSRAPLLLSALLLAPVLLPPARAQDPAPKPDPKPAPKEEPPPLDADLPPEREILREAASDPRNQKPDSFPVFRNPVYVGALEVRGMDPQEWVVGTVVGKTALAFPVNVLNHHEILVDAADGVPFLVTWCPLCRTGTVHSRALDGETLEFGHTGQLYRSAFLLYDTATKSIWHNATGRALAGKARGKRLAPIPSWFVKWDVWRRARPDTRILAKDPLRPEYGADSFDHRNRLLKLQWGLGVSCGGEERLYELSELDRAPVVQESVGGVPVVVVYQGKDLVAAAWERTLDGRVLDLRRAEDAGNGLPRLEETGEERSVFDAVTGACVSGPLKGKALKPLVHCFWEVYAWTAHHPRGTMFRASVPAPQDLPDVPK
jgi:hypothetical protein